jgi:hypothetical protein
MALNLQEKDTVPPVLKDEKVYKVVVGFPLKGHTPPMSYHDRMLMMMHLGDRQAADFYEKKDPRYVFSLACVGEILVPYAREVICQTALDMDADYVLMIDDDMLCMPDLFYQLVKNDKDICAALAFTRNADHKAVAYQVIEGKDPGTGNHFYQNVYVLNYPRNTLFECDAVGFGAVLIKTELLKKIPKPWFMGLVGTGEDITFCYKAKKAGFQVWMDSRLKLGHLSGPTVITEEYSDKWQKLTLEEREKMYGKFTKYPSQEVAR